MKIEWISLGIIMVTLGWWGRQPLPWERWQILSNPFLQGVATVKAFLEPWSLLLLLAGAASVLYGLLAKCRRP